MLKILSRYIARLLLLIILVIGQPLYASANFATWIENTFEDIFNFFANSCLSIPNFNNFTTGSTVMNLSNSGQWVSVGTSVSGGNMLKIQWNTQGITAQPRKYMIIYRIDPRFTRPQVFIVQYNYNTQQYESDFHQYRDGIFLTYQQNPGLNLLDRSRDYDNYFYFRGRSPISVDPGDVINITLAEISELTSLGSQFSSELDGSLNDIASIFTSTGIQDNAILYANSEPWCNYISDNPTDFLNNTLCTQDSTTGAHLFAGPQNSYNRFIGIMDPVVAANVMPLQSCPQGATDSMNNPPCIYDGGRGMKIVGGGVVIKPEYTPFMHSDITNKYFLYYHSLGSGNLDFITDARIINMFNVFEQGMSAWASNNNYRGNVDIIRSYLISDAGYDAGMSRFLHLGRYIMMIDIGNTSNAASYTAQNNVTLEYQVLPAGHAAPAANSPGIAVTSQEYSADAPSSGNLWLKITNPNNEVGGNITISYAYYTGDTFLSDLLYNNVALPVMDMMRSTASIFYSGIAVNPQLQLALKILLSLYIIIYALSFLAGKVQITLQDVITRVIKLGVVFQMFRADSWLFFNENVFNLFLGGMSYLAENVVGVTSSVGNLFGFVDIIFDKYTNPKVWQILIVEALQIQNGMTYLAILMIEAIFSYLAGVVEVVICYVMAYLTMCVLISLAPLFIVCMLFERTKGMFDNWMSLLFNYMIQPTVLLVFFLLIDQLMTNQFSTAVAQACWGWLITIDIDLDLHPIGVDFRVQFDLPFLPGIPFYRAALVAFDAMCPFVSSGGELTVIAGAVLMFKIYAQLSNGLIEYVTSLVGSLTGVTPARASSGGGATNVASKIGGQLKAPANAVINKANAVRKDAVSKLKAGYKNAQLSDKPDKPDENPDKPLKDDKSPAMDKKD